MVMTNRSSYASFQVEGVTDEDAAAFDDHLGEWTIKILSLERIDGIWLMAVEYAGKVFTGEGETHYDAWAGVFVPLSVLVFGTTLRFAVEKGNGQ